MEKCIQSVLAGGEDVEVIIVDDGSTKDETAKIADEYAAKYPTIVKAVHQENGLWICRMLSVPANQVRE